MNPILKDIRRFRMSLGYKRSESYQRLSKRVRAVRLQTREQIANMFSLYWPLDKSKSSECAPTIDLEELLKPFSHSERRAIAKHTVAIQLTQGCNGKCFFCSFGLKNGVTAKISFSSLKIFLSRYGHLIPRQESFLLYWDSDPFDYQDGVHDFLDIFLLVKNNVSSAKFVSTALPRGSEASFVRFVDTALQERFWKKGIKIRISLSAINIKRVEAIFAYLIARLKKAGYSEDFIDKAFSSLFEITYRHKQGIYPCGEILIEKADALRDGSSLGCADGAIITPESIYASVVMFSSRYHPSGDLAVELKPGKTISLLPERPHKEILVPIIDEHLHLYMHVKTRIGHDIFLPPPMSHHGRKYWLFFAEMEQSKPNKYAAYLSRNCLSMRLFLVFVGRLNYKPIDPGPIRTRRYLMAALKEYEGGMRRLFSEMSEGAKELIEKLDFGPEREKLEYFSELSEAYIAMTDSLFEIVRKKLDIVAISYMADKLVSMTLDRYRTITAESDGISAWVNKYGNQAHEFLQARKKRKMKRIKSKNGK